MDNSEQDLLERNTKRLVLLSYAQNINEAGRLIAGLSQGSDDITLLAPYAPMLALSEHGSKVVIAMISKARPDQLKMMSEPFAQMWTYLEAALQCASGANVIVELIRANFEENRQVSRRRLGQVRGSDMICITVGKCALVDDVMNAVPHSFWHTYPTSFPVLNMIFPLLTEAKKMAFVAESSVLFTAPFSTPSPLIDHLSENKPDVIEMMQQLVEKWIKDDQEFNTKMVDVMLQGSLKQAQFVLQWAMWLRKTIIFGMTHFVTSLMGDGVSRKRQSLLLPIIIDDLLSVGDFSILRLSLLDNKDIKGFIVRTLDMTMRQKIAVALGHPKFFGRDTEKFIAEITAEVPEIDTSDDGLPSSEVVPTPPSTPSTVRPGSSTDCPVPAKKSKTESLEDEASIDESKWNVCLLTVSADIMNENEARRLVKSLEEGSVKWGDQIVRRIEHKLINFALNRISCAVVMWFLWHGSMNQKSLVTGKLRSSLERLKNSGLWDDSALNKLKRDAPVSQKCSDEPSNRQKWKEEMRKVYEEMKQFLDDPVSLPLAVPKCLMNQKRLEKKFTDAIENEYTNFNIISIPLWCDKVADPESMVRRICESAAYLCTRSNLIALVAYKWSAKRKDISLVVKSRLACVCSTASGRNLLAILLEQETTPGFLDLLFEGGDASPFISLLNEDKDLADKAFNAAENSLRNQFVSDHNEAIMKTRHGVEFMRGLIDKNPVNGLEINTANESESPDAICPEIDHATPTQLMDEDAPAKATADELESQEPSPKTPNVPGTSVPPKDDGQAQEED